MAPPKRISDKVGKRRLEESDPAADQLQNTKIRCLSLLSITPNDITLYFEPRIRKMVQGIVRPMLQRCLTNRSRHGGRGNLQLCFCNKLPPRIFTQTNIRAEGGEPLQIELRDQQRVVRDESYSPMRIRICVLKGEFGSDGKEDWTTNEFNSWTAIPKKGREPLLKGNKVVTLINGVGYINQQIVFTDISRTSTKTFRLGLQIIDQPESIGSGVDIREGRSEPFRVMDNRGKAQMKFERPLLTDKVWRLKGMTKGGTSTCLGIETVKDLLRLYITNEDSLREKLGKTAWKSWDAIVALAKCYDVVDDGERYIYQAKQSISLVFNCIYQVLEVTFDGQNYRSVQSLVDLEEKRCVEIFKQQAYNNLTDLKPLDTTTHVLGMTSTAVQTAQNGGQDHGLQQIDIPISQQGQPELWPSSSTFGEMLPTYSAYPTEEYSYVGIPRIDSLTGEFFPSLLDEMNVNGFPLVYGDDGAGCSNHSSLPNCDVCTISRNGKGKKVWQKIRTTFKWVMLHVVRRRAQVFPYQYYG